MKYSITKIFICLCLGVQNAVKAITTASNSMLTLNAFFSGEEIIDFDVSVSNSTWLEAEGTCQSLNGSLWGYDWMEAYLYIRIITHQSSTWLNDSHLWLNRVRKANSTDWLNDQYCGTDEFFAQPVYGNNISITQCLALNMTSPYSEDHVLFAAPCEQKMGFICAFSKGHYLDNQGYDLYSSYHVIESINQTMTLSGIPMEACLADLFFNSTCYAAEYDDDISECTMFCAPVMSLPETFQLDVTSRNITVIVKTSSRLRSHIANVTDPMLGRFPCEDTTTDTMLSQGFTTFNQSFTDVNVTTTEENVSTGVSTTEESTSSINAMTTEVTFSTSTNAMTTEETTSSSTNAITTEDTTSSSTNAITTEASTSSSTNAMTTEDTTSSSTNAITTDESTTSSTNAITTEESTSSSTNAMTTEEITSSSTNAITTEESTSSSTNAMMTEDTTSSSTNAMATDESTSSSTNAMATEESTSSSTNAVTTEESTSSSTIAITTEESTSSSTNEMTTEESISSSTNVMSTEGIFSTSPIERSSAESTTTSTTALLTSYSVNTIEHTSIASSTESGESSSDTTTDISTTSTTVSTNNLDNSTTHSTLSDTSSTASTQSTLVSSSQHETSLPTTSSVCVSCFCNNGTTINKTEEQIQEEITQIKKNLTIEKTTLSSYTRQKISAPDSRWSSAALGTVGIVVIAAACGFVVLSDVQHFITAVKMWRKRLAKCMNRFSENWRS